MSVNLKKKQKTQVIIFYLLILLFLCFLVFFPRLSLPMGFSYMSALLLRPWYNLFLRSSLKFKFLYSLFFLGVLAGLIFPIVYFLNNLVEEVGQINNYIPEIENLVKNKVIELKSFLLDRFNFKLEFDPSLLLTNKIQGSTQKILLWFPKILGTFLEWMMLFPLFFIFFLASKDKLQDNLFKIIPNQLFERVYVLADQFNSKFIDYIFAKMLEAFIVGLLITVGLSFLGFPYAAVLGVLAGVTNILPYLGPIIGVVPVGFVFVVGDISYSDFGMALLVYLVANLIDMILVFPLMVSKIVNLNPVVVIMSVIIGSQLGGIMGMILSVPIAAFLKILFNEISKEIYS